MPLSKAHRGHKQNSDTTKGISKSVLRATGHPAVPVAVTAETAADEWKAHVFSSLVPLNLLAK